MLASLWRFEQAQRGFLFAGAKALLHPRRAIVAPSFVGHFGIGDLEITVAKSEDLERAMPLIKCSFEGS